MAHGLALSLDFIAESCAAGHQQDQRIDVPRWSEAEERREHCQRLSQVLGTIALQALDLPAEMRGMAFAPSSSEVFTVAHHFAYVAARRAAEFLTTCAAVVALSATTAHAQNTFELISGGTVSNTPGLRAMTIRDSSLSICYTVFVVQSPTPLLSLAPTLPDHATARSIERARALAEERDRRLADLEAQIENELGKQALPLQAEQEQAEQEYEQARLRLDLEYQRALRHEIPESYPWASVLPGVRSGGLEDAANANRRASLDADPTSVMKTLSDQLTLQTELLRLFVEAPRLTSSGPFACPTSRP